MDYSNPSMLILIPNIQSQEDLKERLNDLANSCSFHEEIRLIKPDNMIAPNEWEYDCFPSEIETMSDLFDHLRVTDPEIFGLKR